MTSWAALVLAVSLDSLVGDPPVSWHPVRLLGRFAQGTETWLRRSGAGRAHGVLAWSTVVGTTLGLGAILLWLVRSIAPAIELPLSTLMIYSAIAPRDLSAHALRVRQALARSDLVQARKAVGSIVGRDTDELDCSEVSRAAVEAVAESTVDGITAPLFWAFALGPLGAVGYRAINTLDSLWGHRDARYLRFGWLAARADDVAGWMPARVTLTWIAAGAMMLGLRPGAAVRVALRDGPKHESPNSGLAEAAFAGALGVRLGGRNSYQGMAHDGPRFGDAIRSAEPDTIRTAVHLMWMTTVLATGTLGVARWFTDRV